MPLWKTESANKEQINMSKILVAYFSATGNTAEAAKRLADAVEGDLFEIKAAVP